MSKLRKRIIVTICFNNLDYDAKRLTKEWIEKRLNLFWTYTLPCLKAQSNQDYLAIIICDVQSMELIHTLLSKREPLPDNIRFLSTHETSIARLNYISSGDLYYAVRLDSDNTLRNDYIERLSFFEPAKDTEAILAQKGYVYSSVTKQLAYFEQDSGPFYTLIYTTEEFKKGKQYRFPGGHLGLTSTLRYELLDGNNYIVNIHDSNVSNSNALLRGRILVPNPSAVLKEFGLALPLAQE